MSDQRPPSKPRNSSEPERRARPAIGAPHARWRDRRSSVAPRRPGRQYGGQRSGGHRHVQSPGRARRTSIWPISTRFAAPSPSASSGRERPPPSPSRLTLDQQRIRARACARRDRDAQPLHERLAGLPVSVIAGFVAGRAAAIADAWLTAHLHVDSVLLVRGRRAAARTGRSARRRPGAGLRRRAGSRAGRWPSPNRTCAAVPSRATTPRAQTPGSNVGALIGRSNSGASDLDGPGCRRRAGAGPRSKRSQLRLAARP